MVRGMRHSPRSVVHIRLLVIPFSHTKILFKVLIFLNLRNVHNTQNLLIFATITANYDHYKENKLLKSDQLKFNQT